MKSVLEQAKEARKFVSPNLIISEWDDIQEYFLNLETRDLQTVSDLEAWMKDRTELESVLEEEMAWRYIKMNCDTANQKLAKHFTDFVSNIEPKIAPFSNVLDKKLLATPLLQDLDEETYFVLIRALKKRDSLFREENVAINAELQNMEQEYGRISSNMTVEYDGKTQTLQQAAVYLKNLNREIREEVFLKIHNRRLQDENELNELLTSLIKKRHQVALNAGFENYRDFKLEDLGRFDYSKEDCFDFHESIAETIPSILSDIQKNRREKLGLSELKPWDLDVDPENKAPLVPFKVSEELIEKSLACFKEIRPIYANYIETMVEQGYMDLDSRIGKAPGGFNYPLYESNLPFIFMNSAGTLSDVETMVHECGHAIHSCISADLPLVEFKNLPSEVAELASMSMELISMEHWHHFFNNEEDLKRAKRSQLEGVLSVLPWVAIVDKFQHWLYENPNHLIQQREDEWNSILSKYSTGVIDWTGLENFQKMSWQRQLHIFEVPFYYIEYGIAQLGAIAMWRKYLNNPQETLNNYEEFMKLGYTVTIPEIYKAAGIEFNFSKEYVTELIDFVKLKLAEL